MKAVIIAGPDPHDIRSAFKSQGVTVEHITLRATASELEQAGIKQADLFILTDPNDGTAIPVARELNTDIRVVVYADGRVAEFARHQADLLIDPSLIQPGLLLEELLSQ